MAELLGMGFRQRAYWIREAAAIQRQWVAVIAQGVGIGMAADANERQKAIDELELVKPLTVSKAERSKATWDLLKLFRGGRSV